MKKPIELSDIEDYLAERSDFSFEMSILEALEKAYFNYEHAGAYMDPVRDDKFRQFDIRAWRNEGSCWLWLSVECKNLRPESPLLVHAVPRSESEAFHEILVFTNLPGRQPGISDPVIRRAEGGVLYPPDEPVGRQLRQVSRNPNTGEFVNSDSEVFDKQTQAINSAADLIVLAAGQWNAAAFHIILPVLVVPDDRLWVVRYDRSGRQQGVPTREERTSLFISQPWPIHVEPSAPYTISHLEIVTRSGLEHLLKGLALECYVA